VKKKKKLLSHRHNEVVAEKIELDAIIARLLDHCFDLTVNTRNYLKNVKNISQVPNSSKEYPGKCDNASVVAIRAGSYIL